MTAPKQIEFALTLEEIDILIDGTTDEADDYSEGIDECQFDDADELEAWEKKLGKIRALQSRLLAARLPLRGL